MRVEILRPLPAGGKILAPGSVLDATGWANLPTLIEQGYVRPAPPAAPPVPPAAPPAPSPAPARDVPPALPHPRRRR